MSTSECIIYMPAYLDKQFSHTFQSANLTFQNCVITFKKFQVLSSTFQNTQFSWHRQTKEQIHDINYKFVFGVRHKCWAVWISALYACCVMGDLQYCIGGGFNWSRVTSSMATHVPLCARLSLKYLFCYLLWTFSTFLHPYFMLCPEIKLVPIINRWNWCVFCL